MINETLYRKTVDILYNAYFNDTLKHEDCTACAVGNICLGNGVPNTWREGVGFQYAYNNAAWRMVFITLHSRKQNIDEDFYTGDVKKVIDATGYTWQELAKIEFAFESAPKGNSDEDWMFNGLQNVLEVLREIHQADEPTHDAAVQPFATHYATKQPA